jgi:hypothetical protein
MDGKTMNYSTKKELIDNLAPMLWDKTGMYGSLSIPCLSDALEKVYDAAILDVIRMYLDESEQLKAKGLYDEAEISHGEAASLGTNFGLERHIPKFERLITGMKDEKTNE